MSDGATSFSAPSGSQLPDKQLVVKCKYNTHRQKLTFQSARNCTYAGLQEKVLSYLFTPHILNHRLSDQEALRVDYTLRDTMGGRRRRADRHSG